MPKMKIWTALDSLFFCGGRLLVFLCGQVSFSLVFLCVFFGFFDFLGFWPECSRQGAWKGTNQQVCMKVGVPEGAC